MPPGSRTVLFVFLFVFERSSLINSAVQPNAGQSHCENDQDCAISGRCLPIDEENASSKRCLCPRSCPQIVPLMCNKHRHCNTHHAHGNYCDKESKLCLCPSSINETCVKRNAEITYVNVTKDTPYVGENTTFFCCINIDPRSVRMVWTHNNTKEFSPTIPFDEYTKCGTLNVSSVRYEDSGTYTCTIRWRSSTGEERLATSREKSIPVQVRAPVTVQLSTMAVNSTAIWIGWRVNPATLGVNLRVEGVEEKRVVFERRKYYESTNVTVSKGLHPGRWYTVYIETMPLKDNRIANDKKSLPTMDAIPGPPQLRDMLIQDKISRTRCEITWTAPKEPNGKILYYQLDLVGVLRRPPSTEGVLVGEHRPHSVNCRDLRRVPADQFMICEFEGLLPNRNYSASIVAVNSAGKSNAARFEKACVTNYGPPASIESPLARGGPSNETVIVEFPTPPEDVNGPITCYYLALVPYTHNSSVTLLKAPSLMDVDSYERAIETNLYREYQPRYAYIAQSYTSLPKRTIVGDQQQANDTCTVLFAGRYAPNNSPLKPGFKYVGYLIVRVDSDASIYQLKEGRRRLRRRRRRLRRKRQSWLQPSYGYSDYFNTVVPGENGAGSDIYGTEGSLTGPTNSSNINPEKPSVTVTAVLLSLLVVFLLVFAFGVLYFAYRKGWLKHGICFETNFVPNRRVYESPRGNQRDFPPIPVDDLPATYLSKHRDTDFMFTVEFEALPHFVFATSASDRADNAHKNRYNDIKAFDITRVKLLTMSPAAGPAMSDYINASTVQGYKGRKEFIAAQGPTQETINDFWRMIWEQRVQIVVMVTNLQERYRAMCVKYWPEQTSMIYGHYEVMPLDCCNYADYVVRKFEVQKANLSNCNGATSTSTEIRPIIQYHYTGWSDYRAPEGTIGLLRFLKRLRSFDAFNDSPVLVHCSAGVGRTGTFIAIDGMMDQINEEKRADVFGFVSNLRRQRNFMVQSLEQYVFIYKALAEWYLFGDTDIEGERIHEHVKELREPSVTIDPKSPSQDAIVPMGTGMKREYDRLIASLEDMRSCEFANRQCNLSKNRYASDVPFDQNRVILAPIIGELDRSYINATVVKGYFYKYILTQDPMVDTIWDFWRMVVEQDVVCVVMLTDESSLAAGEKYWPQEIGKNVVHGEKPSISVSLVSEDDSPSVLAQKFHVSSTKERDVREVHQFIYRDWNPPDIACTSESCGSPSSSSSNGDCATGGGCWRHAPLVPRSTVSFLDLIGRVLQRQSHVPDPGPIVIHCRNGSERSGLYCAVSILLERLRAEGRADVFQTVKTLQAQRRHVISGLPQYEFCYQSIIDYMESFR